jgi:hypothetical protein
MTDIERARHLFEQAGLAFPTIPPELAARLKEHDKWLFSTRKVDIWPYDLRQYVDELDRADLEDYAILSHSGHGVNSYAIQYYLVRGPLRMFLYLGWGGVHMDAEASAAKVRQCFSLADKIVSAMASEGRLATDEQLRIVCSDFYGSYWLAPGHCYETHTSRCVGPPADVLGEVLDWLSGSTS